MAGLRTTLLDDQPLPIRGLGGLVWLAVDSLAWLAAGALVFAVGEMVARRQGSLARY